MKTKVNKGRMNKMNRDDLLELTRRMTLQRSCFSRMAGAYLDEEGFVDGTFHTQFLKLSARERTANLEIAKAIPFSRTNENLILHRFSKDDEKQGSFWQFLMALNECELKNDAILDVLYEVIGERYHADYPYGIFFFHGSYDIPLKGKDKESLWESEEVYKFIICAICPLHGEYEPGKPECGFLFPAFTDRSSDIHGIAVFNADANRPHKELLESIIRSNKGRTVE